MLDLDFEDDLIKQTEYGELEFNTLIPSSKLSNEEYHSLDGISASGLKQAHKDPKLFFNKEKLQRLPSTALELGSALHEAILTPESFDEENYKLTPANKEKLEILINNSKVMFDYILKNTINEHTLIVKDNGLIRRVRMDAYDKQNGIIYDVKTTRYPNKNKFIKDVYELDYHLQAAFYLDTLKLAGLKANAFAFLVVPTDSPCEPFAIQLSRDFIEDGRAVYTEVLENIGEFLKSKKTKQEVFFHMADLPNWRKEQLGVI